MNIGHGKLYNNPNVISLLSYRDIPMVSKDEFTLMYAL